MSASTLTPADRIARRIRNKNRELYISIAVDAGMGLLFTGLSFGALLFGVLTVVLWVGPLSVSAWTLTLIISGLLLAACFVMAWLRFDPFAGLKPMTDAQQFLTMLSQVSGDFLYVSPRHSMAGFVAFLMGGPANLLGAVGGWCHRLPDDPVLMQQAASVLAAGEKGIELERISSPAAALLLKRLGLVKTQTLGSDTMRLVLTDKGTATLHGKRKIVPPTRSAWEE